MKLLIFEYITGGGMLNEPLPATLLREGKLMLETVAFDFSNVKDVEVTILRDHRVQSSIDYVQEFIVSAEQGYEEIIDSLSQEIHALLIIAPETDNILLNLCKQYSNKKYLLLNSDIQSIEKTGDKFITYKTLENYNIKQIPTFSLHELPQLYSERIVIKPKDGVGCEKTKIIGRSNKTTLLNSIESEKKSDYICQPFIDGQHISLSLLCLDGKCLVLSANKQVIQEVNGTFELHQCVVNSIDKVPFLKFSKNLVSSLPGLKGYIGVDLIRVDDEIYLVEINPRLTTSYVGLGEALNINPANLILKIFLNNAMPELNEQANKSVSIIIGDEHAA